MAENNVPVTNQSEVEMEEQRLKYLQFVQMAALHALLYASKAYSYAKNNSGPLKPKVETIEGTLKTVVSPAYDKYHHVPVEVLKFVDRKVDETVDKFGNRVQPFVKQVSTKTKNLSAEVKTAGLAKTAYTKLEPTAKGLYTKYEPVAEQYAVSAWQSLNQLPLFPKVAKVVVPTAAYCSEKYNQTVQQTAEKGYKVSSYLPLVPTERIAKVFNPVEPVGTSGGEGVVVSH
ncbi:putative rubber elongation factor [Helianthus annuus]|uniref:Rubber elongation factor n=1 Tax=Helianthus annuus TaxID=4232 RepID=A0A251TC00_HELAN|nr:REF/SRPP-like protein At3g05500 [Helianthus annuus]KAF5781996.1 putative rubber elongation factor [Helianthus annuus]KAJ0501534.1 putative rubber elongation factor [Helianthus annuus]KAJ0509347.1 putative rubber elongation factor [Helianthus annuus]KAJ0517440.1 putative rubber elongation factor [Helianthus annuus]KAJ0685450.1 putative rubber elongation factor [Helianthus annuus]